MNLLPWRSDCRFFNGYKPCRHLRPCEDCPLFEARGPRVLLLNLAGMGDVVRNTSLLAPLRRALPGAHITWLTRSESAPLLLHQPDIDRLLIVDASTAVVLDSLSFDLALGADKSLEGGAWMGRVRAREKRGFGIDSSGTVIPLNPEALPLWTLGLDNYLKFFGNAHSHPHNLASAFALPWERDPYALGLSKEEELEIPRLRHTLAREGEVILGFNTGCAPWLPYKKLTVADTVRVIAATLEACRTRGVPLRVVLLGGGTADQERNGLISQAFPEGVVALTPTHEGLRRGLLWIAACDAVFSGDTLGLHAAIALGKPVVAWFGVTSHEEVDLHDKGVTLLADVPCRPCWQSGCDREVKCYQKVPLEEGAQALGEMAETLHRSGKVEMRRTVGVHPHPDTDVEAVALRWGRQREGGSR